MSRYQSMFSRLQKSNKIAFVPFVTIGDPNRDQSIELIKTMINSGCDALELGIPFSDPIADGPTIQQANYRALTADIKLNDCWQLISELREFNQDIPIGLLVYCNLILTRGIDRFFAEAANAGVDSVLIVDVPLIEADRFRNAATKQGIDSVYIVSANCSKETMIQAAKLSSGYCYVMSRSGVTGAETEAQFNSLSDIAQQLKQHNSAPALLGFGISTPEHVQRAKKYGFNGVIVGSAIVKIIEANLNNPTNLNNSVASFVKQLNQSCFKTD